MADNSQVINLYSELADNPKQDFGWDKGIENAKAHKYSDTWFKELPHQIWDYCAAVGNPFALGEIKEGATVVDLGCGAGVDLLIAAHIVGDNGKAIGIDITPKMVLKAKEHAKLSQLNNIEVYESSFDSTSIEDESVDIVISNGAINLTSCKESVFSEIHRILKPNGKIYFADMIDISKDNESCNSEELSCCASDEDWANCVAGTLKKDALIDIIKSEGFRDVECASLTHYTTADTTQGATFRATKVSSEDLRQNHWDGIFKSVDYTKVLWHEKLPKKSLELIKKYSNKNSSVIDIGCGASLLVDELLYSGYKDITLLDTSKASLEIVKERLDGEEIGYICSDVLNFQALKKFDIWHDRALFHFLKTKKERVKYFEVLENSLSKDARAIISTFRVDGPISCAGLNIIQYNYEKMSSELPSSLILSDFEEYNHMTFKGKEQKYIYFVIKKL